MIILLYILGIEEQRKQLISVIDYLKSTGISQKEIAFEIGVDNVYMSHLRSGTVKYITPEVLRVYTNKYNINPKYITHGASNMFDIASTKYEHFENFVDAWDLIKHENNAYLHFTIDENFYKFLISVYNLKEASQDSNDVNKMAEAFGKAFESLKENFSNSSVPKEYGLIPADDMIEIASDNISKRKSLSEVINILNLTSSIE